LLAVHEALDDLAQRDPGCRGGPGGKQEERTDGPLTVAARRQALLPAHAGDSVPCVGRVVRGHRQLTRIGPMNEVTRILSAIEQGDAHAAAQLLPLVYDELRQLASQRLAQEKAGQTLQSTALVHEAYLRLVDVEQGQHFNSRGHFFEAVGLSRSGASENWSSARARLRCLLDGR
jgi:hypothetical protein